MTEMEKQFFETFDIEPRDSFKGCENGITFYTYDCDIPSCRGCSKAIREKVYPKITDRIYLELIRIHFGTRPYDTIGYRENLDQLKEFVLKELTESYKNDFYDFREEVKEKVQALFKENNNDR